MPMTAQHTPCTQAHPPLNVRLEMQHPMRLSNQQEPVHQISQFTKDCQKGHQDPHIYTLLASTLAALHNGLPGERNTTAMQQSSSH